MKNLMITAACVLALCGCAVEPDGYARYSYGYDNQPGYGYDAGYPAYYGSGYAPGPTVSMEVDPGWTHRGRYLNDW
jgi:hypothetical protein